MILPTMNQCLTMVQNFSICEYTTHHLSSQQHNTQLSTLCNTRPCSDAILYNESYRSWQKIIFINLCYNKSKVFNNTHTTTPTQQHPHNNTHTTTPTQQHPHNNTHTTTPTQQHPHNNTHTTTPTQQQYKRIIQTNNTNEQYKRIIQTNNTNE